MNFQRGKKHEDLEMNLVPLIDVLLVIIIFLVTWLAPSAVGKFGFQFVITLALNSGLVAWISVTG